MGVKYQVERRPISPTDGKVYRGTGYGDYIVVPTESVKLTSLQKGSTQGTGLGASIYPAMTPSANIKTSQTITTNFVELNGEPWLVHSTHFSVESAIESAAPLAGALGKENVRIVKVLSHTTQFKLN